MALLKLQGFLVPQQLLECWGMVGSRDSMRLNCWGPCFHSTDWPTTHVDCFLSRARPVVLPVRGRVKQLQLGPWSVEFSTLWSFLEYPKKNRRCPSLFYSSKLNSKRKNCALDNTNTLWGVLHLIVEGCCRGFVFPLVSSASRHRVRDTMNAYLPFVITS